MKSFDIKLLIYTCFLSIVFTGCTFQRGPTSRIPVMCEGKPQKDDYLITEQGDLLINGEKCKFKFPQDINKKQREMRERKFKKSHSS